ncbi:MAG: DcrB-related protein [Bacteroidetes bacterium]|nr:DcrB-related protein [Bacteroidota bacterium]
MNKYVIGFLAGLLLFTACKDQSKKPSVEEVLKQAGSTPGVNAGTGNFDIEAPAGWSKIDTSFSNLKATLLMAPDTSRTFRANVNVVTESMHGSSMDKYFDDNVTALSSYMPQFSLVGKGEKEVAGLKSKYLHYYGQSPKGLGMEQVLYVISSKGIAYLITCTSKKGELDKDQPSFDQALSSFKLH